MNKHQPMRIDNMNTVHADSGREKLQYGLTFGYTLCGIQFGYRHDYGSTTDPVSCKRCIRSLIVANRVTNQR